MARPKGRTKTARVTINLDERAYALLLALAERDDAPVAQVARKAVVDFLNRAEPTINQGSLPLVRPQREDN
jgi:predicted transcriptional regulator